MRFWPRSIRLRLTLWYAAALTIIVVAFSAAVYLLVRRSLTGQAEAQLERDLSVLRRVIADDLHDLHELDEHGSIMYFRIRGTAGVLFETADWKRAHLAGAAADGQPGVTRHWHSPSDHTFFLRSDAVTAPPQGQEHLPGMRPGEQLDVTVATDAELAEQSLHTLLLALVLGVPCAALAAIVGGYFLAGRVLSPVGAMAKKAAQITADNLGERLPVENSDDELGRLATVFNETLARIEDAFGRLRRFTSDASHQLRTPLAAIRSVGEVALREQGAPGNHREVIGSILEEVDRLTRLVDGLLVLTRGDLPKPYVQRESLNLTTVTAEVVELLRALAEEKAQDLSFEAGAAVPITAERATLRQALLNLLDNAIKYTPPAGRITVRVGRSAEGLPSVEITDSGPGIPAEDQKRIFDRFYRAPRSVETRGTGLGLAIARWAAELNGGRIDLESTPGAGSIFRLVLPSGGAESPDGERRVP